VHPAPCTLHRKRKTWWRKGHLKYPILGHINPWTPAHSFILLWGQAPVNELLNMTCFMQFYAHDMSYLKEMWVVSPGVGGWCECYYGAPLCTPAPSAGVQEQELAAAVTAARTAARPDAAPTPHLFKHSVLKSGLDMGKCGVCYRRLYMVEVSQQPPCSVLYIPSTLERRSLLASV